MDFLPIPSFPGHLLNLASPLKLFLNARQDLAGVQHRVAVLVGGDALDEEASLW